MSSYISCNQNNILIKDVYKKLLAFQIEEASSLELFNLSSIASLRLQEIKDIELGTDGTKKTIVRLDKENFIVLNGTVAL